MRRNQTRSPLQKREEADLAWYDFFTKTPGKVIDTATDLMGSAASGIDKLILTEEERIEFKIKYAEKVMGLWLDTQKTIASESSIRSVTRRIIAVAFIAVFLTLIIASCIVWPFNPGHAQYIHKSIEELGTPIVTIIIFYFGYYAVSNVIKTKKGS